MKLSCNVTRDLLPLYHDGVCSGESGALVEAHIAECEDCRALLNELRGEIELNIPAPDDLAPLKQIEKNVKKGKKRAWFRGVATVLAAILVLAAGCLAWGYGDWAAKKEHYEKFVAGKDDYRLIYRHQPSESLWDGTPEYHTWSGIGYRFRLILRDPFRGSSEVIVMPIDNSALFEDGDSRYIYLTLTVDREGAVTCFAHVEKPTMLIEEVFEITWSTDLDTGLPYRVHLVGPSKEHDAMARAYEDQLLGLVTAALEQWPFLAE